MNPGAHAVVLLDQAGWHTFEKLVVPANISLLPLPPKSPELEPGGERLATSTRQLALQPDVRVRHRHRRIGGVRQSCWQAEAVCSIINALTGGRSGAWLVLERQATQ